MKLWGGRFHKSPSKLVDKFNASIQFDQQLANVDIQGSLAHVAMLGECGILSFHEVKKIQMGLNAVAQKIQTGEYKFSVADEDIHMNIERLLHQEIGEVAGKLHTGRSRNDQVALDLHLYLRNAIIMILNKIVALQQALIDKAHQHTDTLLPGYTHLQRAEPVRLAHHLLAYVAMLQRDCDRLCDSWPRVNCSPLGAGAIAGSGFKVDPDHVAQLLQMNSIYHNSMDAVSDRDFIVEFLSHAALIIMHLSRMSEELILWSSQEFAFIEMDENYCTGSSMMPQKKNPDVAELIRGKSGRVFGALMSILTVLKGLPLTYNKDLQEDKEGLFDTVKTIINVLDVATPMISTMKINIDNMANAVKQDFSNATQVANYLVSKGLTFRKAHEVTGKIVQHCLKTNKLIADLSLSDLRTHASEFDHDIAQVITTEAVVNAHCAKGGTGKEAVQQQFEIVDKKLEQSKQWLKKHELKSTDLPYCSLA